MARSNHAAIFLPFLIIGLAVLSDLTATDTFDPLFTSLSNEQHLDAKDKGGCGRSQSTAAHFLLIHRKFNNMSAVL